MTHKENIMSDSKFELLLDYLESMFPDRYEFKEDELLIYYPKITITNTIGQTYDIYKVFIHFDYNKSYFEFTKLHYSVTDYINQSSTLFTHSHLSRSTTAFKTSSYCIGKLDMCYSFNDLPSLIRVITTVDFWLHNENSSDCYTPLATLFIENGQDSLTSLTFNSNIKNELEISDITINDTIFGLIVNVDWDDKLIASILERNSFNKIINCSQSLRNIIDGYQNFITFKGENYYNTIDGFDAKYINDNTKTNINEHVVQQFKQMATTVVHNSDFATKIERYYFERYS